jgi:uncharacterized protein (DUF433 family)
VGHPFSSAPAYLCKPLLDYLEAGDPLDEFLEDFPTVSRQLAINALEQAPVF